MQIRIFVSASMALLMTAAGSTAVHAQAVSGQGTWETTLLGRDVNLNAVVATSVDAVYLYDTTLNVTWLRNANVAGQMDWNTANTWATNLVTGSGAAAISDWRLPSMTDPNAVFSWSNGGTTGGYNVPANSSEMASLFFNTLGNRSHVDTNGVPQTGWGLTNTGSFQNLQNFAYWLGTEGLWGSAWNFYTSDGIQDYFAKPNQLDAMAVRNGDVGSPVSPVPEPETYAMLLAGLGLLGTVTRRRRSIGTSGDTPCQS